MKNQKAAPIEKLILEDHKPLKKLIKKMKDEKSSISEKKAAFDEFAPLLIVHAKAEEKALYTYLKDEEDLREEGFEGQVEHNLADEMVKKAKSSTDKDLKAAEIKVLAELVEHHIKEEEEDMLPDFKKKTPSEVRIEIGGHYLELKNKLANEVPSLGRKVEYERDEDQSAPH